MLDLHQKFFEVIEIVKRFQVLPLDEAAFERFISLANLQTVIGTRDRRIASIALANNAIVVTANRQHFDLVPELIVEDWTKTVV